MEAFVSDDLDLEDPNGARSQALVAECNAEVARRLHDDVFKADRDRLRAIIEDDDKLFVCRKRGAWIYDFHQNADHPRGLWRRLPERPFIREPLFVIAPPGAPPMTADGYLSHYPFVRFRSNVPLAHMIDRELARMNLPLNEIAEIDTVSAIVACVANGLGVSVVPNIAIKECAAPLVTAPFGKPHLYRQIGLVGRPGSPRSSMIADLHACLVKVSEEYGTS